MTRQLRPSQFDLTGTYVQLKDGGGTEALAVVPLDGKDAFIVPQGVWHRIEIRRPGQVLFITPGEGTQHRPNCRDAADFPPGSALR